MQTRSKSDSDFVRAFCNAVDQFTDSGVVFTQNTETAVNAVSEQLLRTYAEVDELIIQGLEAASRRGMDIKRVYRSLHEPDAPITEPEAKQLFEIVFDNLRLQGYSSISESNMRHIVGLAR